MSQTNKTIKSRAEPVQSNNKKTTLERTEQLLIIVITTIRYETISIISWRYPFFLLLLVRISLLRKQKYIGFLIIRAVMVHKLMSPRLCRQTQNTQINKRFVCVLACAGDGSNHINIRNENGPVPCPVPAVENLFEERNKMPHESWCYGTPVRQWHYGHGLWHHGVDGEIAVHRLSSFAFCCYKERLFSNFLFRAHVSTSLLDAALAPHKSGQAQFLPWPLCPTRHHLQ